MSYFAILKKLLKLGEAIIPNDGKCHLDSRNRYALELIQDYPSVGQVCRLVQDNNKNLILAVTEPFVKTYSELFKQAKTVTVAELNKDSSNIIELLEKQYKVIMLFNKSRMKFNA